MKEIFRDRDISRCYFYRALLEKAGIRVILRNETLTMSGITEIPIPEFYPNICVLDDADYAQAWQIIHDAISEQNADHGENWTCASCGEPNPGNFDLCYACGADKPSS